MHMYTYGQTIFSNPAAATSQRSYSHRGWVTAFQESSKLSFKSAIKMHFCFHVMLLTLLSKGGTSCRRNVLSVLASYILRPQQTPILYNKISILSQIAS